MAAAMVRGFSAVARLAGLTSVSTAGSGGGGGVLGGSSWALDEELQADLAAAVGVIGDEEVGGGGGAGRMWTIRQCRRGSRPFGTMDRRGARRTRPGRAGQTAPPTHHRAAARR